MPDVIEVSYTGDLLAHRRCRRAWAFEKRVGFQPYEAVQAMEGRLIHHAMQWLTRQYRDVYHGRRHATAAEAKVQLEHYFRVLWARGIRTRFVSRDETLVRVMDNLFPKGKMDPIVRAVIEGAQHSEYELRAVKKVLPADFAGKSRILLTGILDLVVQQQQSLAYQRAWIWDSIPEMRGGVGKKETLAQPGDVEVWDYKGTRAKSAFVPDYVRQVLTYANLYRDRVGSLPTRCVIFFVNEAPGPDRLLSIPVIEEVVEASLKWTQEQVKMLQQTALVLERAPDKVEAGELELSAQPIGQRLTSETTQQCTACELRFRCEEYRAYLKADPSHPDIDLYNIAKN